jgi:putative hydrolase
VAGVPQPGDEPALPFGFGELDLNQLLRMLQSSGPVNWQVAAQVARHVATDGEPERPIDPDAATELEGLARAAQTQVVAETGLTATFATTVLTTGRQGWAELHLEALRPVLDALATTLGQAFRAPGGGTPEGLEGLAGVEGLEGLGGPEGLAGLGAMGADPMAALLPMLAPLLLGVQAGSMIGYLAQHALGRYDLPLAAADQPSLCFVVPNLDAFEESWSLDRPDLRFTVALHEVVHAAMRSVRWVREHLVTLATDYVSAYEVDPGVLSSRLGDLDPQDPEALQRLAERPEELLGAMTSARQGELLERARVFHAVLEGYADDVLGRVGGRLVPSFSRVHEALARHRIERGEATRFVEQLLGLTLEREDYERGAAFCAGVVERAGPEALNRLWEAPKFTPTGPELDAPGLWLARIDLDLG